MSLKTRLIIYINSLLFLTILIGSIGLMVSAKKNVRDEVLSTQSLAIFAIENGIKKNPEIYLFQEEGEPFGFSKLLNLRHLKIEYYDENRYLRDQTLTNQDY
jgi:two-component system sensor histidine kinase UhpB